MHNGCSCKRVCGQWGGLWRHLWACKARGRGELSSTEFCGALEHTCVCDGLALPVWWAVMHVLVVPLQGVGWYEHVESGAQ